MKNMTLLTTFLLLAAVSNLSTAINTTKTAEIDLPAPEIIACESKGNCEMTTLDVLYSDE